LANILIRGLLNQEKNVQQGLVYLKQAADTNEPESARSAYDLGCIYANDLESIGLEE
jgi:TPR repeat protein